MVSGMEESVEFLGSSCRVITGLVVWNFKMLCDYYNSSHKHLELCVLQQRI